LRQSCGHRAARRMSWGFYHQAACMHIKTIFWLSSLDCFAACGNVSRPSVKPCTATGTPAATSPVM
jgi:hypothetical protein